MVDPHYSTGQLKERRNANDRAVVELIHADDILLISPSVSILQHLLHTCEIELNNIDMAINFLRATA